jgi:hypothetical protein
MLMFEPARETVEQAPGALGVVRRIGPSKARTAAAFSVRLYRAYVSSSRSWQTADHY